MEKFKNLVSIVLTASMILFIVSWIILFSIIISGISLNMLFFIALSTLIFFVIMVYSFDIFLKLNYINEENIIAYEIKNYDGLKTIIKYNGDKYIPYRMYHSVYGSYYLKDMYTPNIMVDKNFIRIFRYIHDHDPEMLIKVISSTVIDFKTKENETKKS